MKNTQIVYVIDKYFPRVGLFVFGYFFPHYLHELSSKSGQYIFFYSYCLPNTTSAYNQWRYFEGRGQRYNFASPSRYDSSTNPWIFPEKKECKSTLITFYIHKIKLFFPSNYFIKVDIYSPVLQYVWRIVNVIASSG